MGGLKLSKEELKEKLIQFAKQYYGDISHPLAVANQFPEMSVEWIVGLFHDILEDTRLSDWQLFLFLTKYNMYKVYLEINRITRDRDETYFEYIKRLKEYNDVCTRVKIADLKHNLLRTETLKPSLKKRYEKALRILES
jgi:(p)ppGpp synthase/HD superfamily hydrolase